MIALCPSITELDPCPMYLVLDKSNIHNTSKIEQAFCNVGYTGLTEVLILPTQAAKRVSPFRQHAIPRMERKNQMTFITY